MNQWPTKTQIFWTTLGRVVHISELCLRNFVLLNSSWVQMDVFGCFLSSGAYLPLCPKFFPGSSSFLYALQQDWQKHHSVSSILVLFPSQRSKRSLYFNYLVLCYLTLEPLCGQDNGEPRKEWKNTYNTEQENYPPNVMPSANGSYRYKRETFSWGNREATLWCDLCYRILSQWIRPKLDITWKHILAQLCILCYLAFLYWFFWKIPKCITCAPIPASDSVSKALFCLNRINI